MGPQKDTCVLVQNRSYCNIITGERRCSGTSCRLKIHQICQGFLTFYARLNFKPNIWCFDGESPLVYKIITRMKYCQRWSRLNGKSELMIDNWRDHVDGAMPERCKLNFTTSSPAHPFCPRVKWPINNVKQYQFNQIQLDYKCCTPYVHISNIYCNNFLSLYIGSRNKHTVV
jgi:hypothetical protein